MIDAVRWRRWILDSLPLVVSPEVTLDSGQGFYFGLSQVMDRPLGGDLKVELVLTTRSVSVSV